MLRFVRPCLVSVLGILFTSVAFSETKPSAGMLRDPDISQDKIVFSYADDLWIVDKTGGTATPLASPAGLEQKPRFSPDGSKIAFVGNYEGNPDIYEIAVSGGIAVRHTYHPGSETLCDWGPDGELVFSTSSYAKLNRMAQLFSISPNAPVAAQLPVPYGTNAAIDGDWLAYTPYSRDTRTWKRYRGGMASDIWLFNLKDHSAKQVTDWEGTDSFPMWHSGTLYYLSDAGPKHRLNLWKTNIKSGKKTQVTKFKRFDVKDPSIGPGSDDEGEIVFQVGGQLRILNLASEKSRAVEITIPGDRPELRPKHVDASDFIAGGSVSPSAKRVAIEARGDIWTAPLENGSPRNLTHSSGSAERSPAWSPDGLWIAYFSDASGEYELMLSPGDGSEAARRLTHDGSAFRFDPDWSPDSKKIFFYDKSGSMFIHYLDTEETEQFDQDPFAAGPNVSWSHDSNWLAYTRVLDESTRTQIRVLNVESGETFAVSSGHFSDDAPAFDRRGDFLFYTSNRDFSQPEYEDVGTTFIYNNTQVLIAVPLRSDVANPLLPTSDEEEPQSSDDKDSEESQAKDDRQKGGEQKTAESKGRKKKKERAKKKKQKDSSKESDSSDLKSAKSSKDGDQPSKDDQAGEDEEDESVSIDVDGIESRSFRIPVPSGNFRSLEVTKDGALAYVRQSARNSSGSPSIQLVTLKDGKAEEKTIVEGGRGFELTADGTQMLVFARGNFYLVKAAPSQKLEKQFSTDGMDVEIDRRSEWRQIFLDAWRIERDFFYDPNMHGVNWKAVRKKYEALLQDCVSRRDLSFIIREMISELNVGHAYYREGDVERGPSRPVGLLGARFEIAEQHVTFGELWQGGVWDTDARNPLTAAGIQTGDKLLAVENIAVSAKENPYQHFIGKVGRAVRIRVQTADQEARTAIVRPMDSDSRLRFWSGIESTRHYVEQESGGRVGYIYVTNTSIDGQNDLFRQFYSQLEKDALIIDDRWNGGGQIPTRFIELLNRPTTNYWARRDGKDWAWPPDSHQGPKCMLINGLAGSGGDMFPALFKQAGLGKLIGRRTWGGLVGITGYPRLVDGSGVTAPSFAYYETDGTWGIEGHGVDPDLEVIDDPAKMLDGGDPQLDAAIELMLEEADKFKKRPKRPAYPNRSRMGLPTKDY